MSDWKKVVSTIAPAVASAFGTPALGVGVAMLSRAIFGDESKSADDVAAAISSGQLTGEQLAAVTAANNQFKVDMARIGVDLAKLEAEQEALYVKDVQDARARQIATKDYTPQAILGILFILWAGTFAMFFLLTVPADEFVRALLLRAYATIEVGLSGAIAYFIGSSRGSKSSGDSIRKIAESK